MHRLAEYLADLASLLGEQERVHFVKLRPGSTNVAFAIEKEAEPKVRKRIHEVKTAEDCSEIAGPLREINRRLASDNAHGELVDPEGERIVEFPGRKKFSQSVIGPFSQQGTIDGIPIMVGGKLDPVPVHLLDEPSGVIHLCYAKRETAIQIAKLLYTAVIRVEGTARMFRDGDGKWICKRFSIHHFSRLDDSPIHDIVARVKGIPDGLAEVEDPLKKLNALRSDERLTG